MIYINILLIHERYIHVYYRSEDAEDLEKPHIF